jgi:hypothetical protein
MCSGFHSIPAAFLIDWAANLGIAVFTKTSHPAAFMLRICESTAMTEGRVGQPLSRRAEPVG